MSVIRKWKKAGNEKKGAQKRQADCRESSGRFELKCNGGYSKCK